MTRQGCCVIALAFDQLAAAQQIERGLDGALREAGFFRERTKAGRDRFPFRAGRLPVKPDVNQVGCRLPIVTDQIRHQGIEHVCIDGDVLVVWQQMP